MQNAVITYIAGPDFNDIKDLMVSLDCLYTNFNNKFKYPVIIFHENYDKSVETLIKDRINSDIKFVEIKPNIPETINGQPVPKDVIGSSVGYRHMCKWCSGDFFIHPEILPYDWYWHLDTDSFLLRPVEYDVFDFMANNGLEYGYQVIYKEQPFAAVGFWNFVKQYIKDNNINPTFLSKFLKNGEWDYSYYYADFEISKLSFWRRKEYMDFFNKVNDTGGFYLYRWGDTILHSMSVFLWMEEQKTHQFKDISWRHQGYIN